MADGRSLLTKGVCKNVQWKTQGFDFNADFMILQLKGCDMVLGIQWLLSFGSITWNFKSLTMQFALDKGICTLQGIQLGNTQITTAAQAMKGFPTTSSLLCPCTMLMVPIAQLTLTTTVATMPRGLQQLLTEFDDLFGNPTGLPPPRAHNHRIPLLDESAVVKIRPYRYPTVQKNEIERIVQEMLHTGVIRDSTSAFASPIVMVKKDGSWWLCVDYKQLNQLTIKDKFPIPLVEELLDELGHARIQSLTLGRGVSPSEEGIISTFPL